MFVVHHERALLAKSGALAVSDTSQAPQPAQTLEKLLPLGCRFDLLC